MKNVIIENIRELSGCPTAAPPKVKVIDETSHIRVQDVEIRINLDEEGNICAHETGNSITFRVNKNA